MFIVLIAGIISFFSLTANKRNENKNSYNDFSVLPSFTPTISPFSQPISTPTLVLSAQPLTKDEILFLELEWEKISSPVTRPIHIRKIPLYTSQLLSGQAWKSHISSDDIDEIWAGIEKFTGYYDTLLEGKEWSLDYNYGGYELSPMTADGPEGSVWSYLSVTDDRLKMVTLSWNKVSNLADVGYGVREACPCQVEYEVFVSDEIAIDEIIDQN